MATHNIGGSVRKFGSRALIYGLLIILSVPFIFPFWWMITSAFKNSAEIFGTLRWLPETWRWQNFREIFTYQPYANHYFNSVYIALAVTGGTLFLGALSGYAFARIRFKGSSVLFLLLLSSLMMPIEVTIIPNFFLMKYLKLIDTHIPLILLPIFGAQGAFVAFMLRQFFLTIPRELEEAATIDGLSRFGTFLRIMLPMAAPALSAAAILTFLHSWNSFLEPLIFLMDLKLFTLPLSLKNFNDAYGMPLWHLQLAATTLSVIPILLLYIVAQKRIVNAMAFSGLKG
ncbi:MAG: carbohydrate ABC transporter permease [bacterium]|nr:carbohydrate ABC transporter permease [bacterium]